MPVAIGTRSRLWRFTVVLLASLLLLVAQPLTAGLFEEERTFNIFLSLLIIAVVLLILEEEKHRKIAFSLGLIAFLSVWVGRGVGGPTGRMFLVPNQAKANCIFGVESLSMDGRNGIGWL
ncbi:MAG: hypothetical protein JW829_10580, partial [Pirellulales bacterium]|nr:hypothetical protein [Pirellulales bacterium]